ISSSIHSRNARRTDGSPAVALPEAAPALSVAQEEIGHKPELSLRDAVATRMWGATARTRTVRDFSYNNRHRGAFLSMAGVVIVTDCSYLRESEALAFNEEQQDECPGLR